MYSLFLFLMIGFLLGFLTIWFLYDENEKVGVIILKQKKK